MKYLVVFINLIQRIQEIKNHIKHQIKYVDEHFGAQKDLLLMDNNVFASNCFEQIND